MLTKYLKAKLESAEELFTLQRISRGELFRAEVDLCLVEDTGPIVYEMPIKGVFKQKTDVPYFDVK